MKRKSILPGEPGRLYATTFGIGDEKIKPINYQQMEIWKERISRRKCSKRLVALVEKYREDLIWQGFIYSFRISVLVLNS